MGREQVRAVGVAVEVAYLQREVALLRADQRIGREVVRRRQTKVARGRNQRVIARVVVGVRDERVKHHPPVQLHHIGGAAPTQFVRQQEVRPAVARLGRVLGTQDRQPADHAVAQVAALDPLAIETLDQHYVARAHGYHPRFGAGDAAFVRQAQHRMLDACIRPAIAAVGKFRNPEPIAILDDVLRPRATDRGAWPQQAFHLRTVRILGGSRLIVHDALSEREQGIELDQFVVATEGRRRPFFEAERQRTRPVIRRVQQQVGFVEAHLTELALDDTPAPSVGQRVA